MSRYATPPRKNRVAGAPASADFLHGTLDALVLKTLTAGPMHGYAIGKSIEDASGGALELEEGSLYPALYRMEKRGWLEAEWGTSELGRRAKFYRLTRAGRQQLASDAAAWAAFAAAVNRILIKA
jgi:transcriptional regulator